MRVITHINLKERYLRMMIGLRNILLIVVGTIILLHTLIPHKHFDEASDVVSLHSHQCTTDIFFDIQISFGVDHGSGHFEHFVQVELDDINAVLLSDQNYDHVFLLNTYPSEIIQLNLDYEEWSTYRLRGPPHLIG